MNESTPWPSILIRGGFGGILMGMANLVPGISGGTMLLAVGIYTGFISAIADLTTLRFRFHSMLLLGTVVFSALLAILSGAGFIKGLVVDHRWIMYSLFIGLTLGGIPLVWRLAKPVGSAFYMAMVAGFGVMVLMALGLGGDRGGGEADYVMLFFSGVGGAASMILPGVSGGYILLLLGQYESILGAIHKVKLGLLGDSAQGLEPNMALVMEAMYVVIPVGLGVLVGVIGVSNLLKWLLRKYEKPTLGVLMGLLLGAVIGLWPFQQGRQPLLGETLHGQVVTGEVLTSLSPEKWPLVTFSPTVGQVFAVLGLVLFGLAVTLGIERLGRGLENKQ